MWIYALEMANKMMMIISIYYKTWEKTINNPAIDSPERTDTVRPEPSVIVKGSWRFSVEH